MLKPIEDLKLGISIESQDIRAAGTLYNGAAVASGTYIDARDYEHLTLTVNAGVIGADNTMDLAIVESNDDDPANATAISGAAFTQLTPSNDQQGHYGALFCAAKKSYLWVRSVKAGTGSCNIGVSYSLKHVEAPVSNSPVFDVDDGVTVS